MEYKTFIFTYYPTKEAKYTEPSYLKATVRAGSAPQAVDLFERTFGSLKKNTLINIQEIAVDGSPVGEPIILKETLRGKKA